jgi:hypothetical protein
MAKKMSPMLTVLLSLVLLSVASVVLVAAFLPRIKEMFYGAQGGEMVQLATSHVPTAEDVKMMQEEQEQVKRDLINMTGSY